MPDYSNPEHKSLDYVFPPLAMRLECVLNYLHDGTNSRWKVFETLRSDERQRYVYRAGTSKTSVRGFHGPWLNTKGHRLGLAVDIVKVVGDLNVPSWKIGDGEIETLTEAVHDQGLTGGVDWGWDYFHIQAYTNKHLREMRSIVREHGALPAWWVLMKLWYEAGPTTKHERLWGLNILRQHMPPV